MDISIITPSLNMLDYLRRCHASIADQKGVSFEHIVMDGGSRDGSAEWLRSSPSVVGVVQPDQGMYDAINKGLRLARGELVSYLNCDEQYLPGTLSFVKEFFDTHPHIDVVAGDTLLIRPDGSLIAYRKAYPFPLPLLLSAHLQFHSSSFFFRRRIVDSGELFDPTLRDVGDQEFVARLLRKKYRFAFCRRYLSAFTMTGANRGQNPQARQEGMKMRATRPRWVLTLSRPLRLVRWAIKLLYGAYFERMPIVYAVYDASEVDSRRVFFAKSASFRWRLA
ncbi:MAG: glycosyltransferase [Chloroflexi bacterium]|nr:glycosyltransferase [Chloroflexota bacterium]